MSLRRFISTTRLPGCCESAAEALKKQSKKKIENSEKRQLVVLLRSRGLMGRDHPDKKSCRGAAAAGCLWAFLFFLFTRVAASTPISDRALEYRGSTGRTLLQAKTSCPVDFQNLNYTVITGQCKEPTYSPKLCCGAFKEFACPYADQLNDLTNNCAVNMVSYINLYGRYPPGLFASLCRDSKRGLECPVAQSPADQQQADTTQNAATVAHGALPLMLLVLWFLFTFMII